MHQPEGLRLRKIIIPKHPRQTVQNLLQKSLFRGIHYLVTKDHQFFHKIQQRRIGYQTNFEGNKTSTIPFLISSQSFSLTSPNSTHIPETIQSCQLSENSFAQTFYDQNNLSQFNQHQQTHMPLILPRLQNDLFPCLNLRPDNIYTQQGKLC